MIDPATVATGWRPSLEAFLASDDGRRLAQFLDERRSAGAAVYPPQPLRALTLTPFERVRVVILGQDPYHGAGQAHGLAFSVPSGTPLPPSLRNIFAELQRDLGCPPGRDGSLEHWAGQGVLLINAVFTVEDSRPGAHAGCGWETLTAGLLRTLAEDARPKVFMLWGAQAQARRAGLGPPHLVLTANHPSPLSARRGPAPFLGCGHFSQANAFLREHGRGVIEWCRPGGADVRPVPLPSRLGSEPA
ncbi:MAG: uracil-DNA glycosylase [Burkholderiaceae bacterium]|nr:uracil-DNA glycosylase [Burkholderiaceae bacterium]MDH5208979.1 uracil-DNA glycosylase [Burkholderiaceae bacterium]